MHFFATEDLRARDTVRLIFWCTLTTPCPRFQADAQGIPAKLQSRILKNRPHVAKKALDHMREHPFCEEKDLVAYMDATVAELKKYFGAKTRSTSCFDDFLKRKTHLHHTHFFRIGKKSTSVDAVAGIANKCRSSACAPHCNRVERLVLLIELL